MTNETPFTDAAVAAALHHDTDATPALEAGLRYLATLAAGATEERAQEARRRRAAILAIHVAGAEHLAGSLVLRFFSWQLVTPHPLLPAAPFGTLWLFCDARAPVTIRRFTDGASRTVSPGAGIIRVPELCAVQASVPVHLTLVPAFEPHHAL